MGKRSDFERVERDFYPTPYSAVVPLLPHLECGDMFLEPCAGKMDLVLHLEANGLSCAGALDISPQHHDVVAFDALREDLDNFCGGADYIITNPPWDRSLLHPMIRRFCSLKPSWLLFDADWMHTKQSAEFMPLLRKVVSVGRVKWIPDSKMTGKDNCAWYLFDAKGDGPATFYGRT